MIRMLIAIAVKPLQSFPETSHLHHVPLDCVDLNFGFGIICCRRLRLHQFRWIEELDNEPAPQWIAPAHGFPSAPNSPVSLQANLNAHSCSCFSSFLRNDDDDSLFTACTSSRAGGLLLSRA